VYLIDTNDTFDTDNNAQLIIFNNDRPAPPFARSHRR
jgi:hypothetical protein